jgi:hypothetical protein
VLSPHDAYFCRSRPPQVYNDLSHPPATSISPEYAFRTADVSNNNPIRTCQMTSTLQFLGVCPHASRVTVIPTKTILQYVGVDGPCDLSPVQVCRLLYLLVLFFSTSASVRGSNLRAANVTDLGSGTPTTQRTFLRNPFLGGVVAEIRPSVCSRNTFFSRRRL